MLAVVTGKTYYEEIEFLWVYDIYKILYFISNTGKNPNDFTCEKRDKNVTESLKLHHISKVSVDFSNMKTIS